MSKISFFGRNRHNVGGTMDLDREALLKLYKTMTTIDRKSVV